MQENTHAEGAGDGKHAEKQVERIKDRRLRVRHKRRPAELMRVPKRQIAGLQRLRREQAPRVKLRHAVPHQRVPGNLGVWRRAPGRDVFQEVGRQEHVAAEHDWSEQEARHECEGKKRQKPGEKAVHNWEPALEVPVFGCYCK